MEDVIVYNINDKKYLLSNEIELNQNKYLYLSNLNNPRDIILRKIHIYENNEYLVRLNDDEFVEVMNNFYEKNKNLFN